MADADKKLYVERQNIESREIPWRYNFLNITALEWIENEASQMTGERKLAFRVSPTVSSIFRGPSSPFQTSLISRIPVSIRTTITNKGLVELDMEKIYICHNKKDSWESWAPPFLYTVLSDVHYKDKLRQADIAALDGMINVLR